MLLFEQEVNFKDAGKDLQYFRGKGVNFYFLRKRQRLMMHMDIQKLTLEGLHVLPFQMIVYTTPEGRGRYF